MAGESAQQLIDTRALEIASSRRCSWVYEENPVRMIDVFVDELDLSGLGFSGVDSRATMVPSGQGPGSAHEIRTRSQPVFLTRPKVASLVPVTFQPCPGGHCRTQIVPARRLGKRAVSALFEGLLRFTRAACADNSLKP
jgi:hypothetical protein